MPWEDVIQIVGAFFPALVAAAGVRFLFSAMGRLGQ